MSSLSDDDSSLTLASASSLIHLVGFCFFEYCFFFSDFFNHGRFEFGFFLICFLLLNLVLIIQILMLTLFNLLGILIYDVGLLFFMKFALKHIGSKGMEF